MIPNGLSFEAPCPVNNIFSALSFSSTAATLADVPHNIRNWKYLECLGRFVMTWLFKQYKHYLNQINIFPTEKKERTNITKKSIAQWSTTVLKVSPKPLDPSCEPFANRPPENCPNQRHDSNPWSDQHGNILLLNRISIIKTMKIRQCTWNGW